MNMNDNDGFIYKDDFIYNEIVHRRCIAWRTNYRLRATALKQRDVALAASIQVSVSFCYTLMYLVLFQLLLCNWWIQLHSNEPNYP